MIDWLLGDEQRQSHDTILGYQDLFPFQLLAIDQSLQIESAVHCSDWGEWLQPKK
jgi:hypothetical protein